MGQPVPVFREPSPVERLFNRAFGVVVGLGLGPRDSEAFADIAGAIPSRAVAAGFRVKLA